MKKRILALLLAALASLSAVACGKTEKDTGTESDSGNESVSESESESVDENARTEKDDVPDVKFDGAKFRSIVQASTPYDIYVESTTGDKLNDAIYDRNKSIEERFDVTITAPEEAWYDQISPKLQSIVKTNDDVYDLVLGQMEQSGKDALNGIFQNWHDIKYVNFEKPWWPKSISQDVATVNGKMYVTLSDLCISYAEQTHIIAFNQRYAADLGIENLFSIVNEGKWTLDMLYELAEKGYNDVNANGEIDEEDNIGYVTGTDGCVMLGYFYSSDQRLMKVNGQEVEMLLDCEKSVDLCKKLYNLFNNNAGTTTKFNDDMAKKGFAAGRILFYRTILRNMFMDYTGYSFRDMEDKYGILPLPKYDEAQSDYYTICDAGCNIMAIPTTAQNVDMIGAVVEALSAESWRSVLPTYINNSLGSLASRDPETAAMVMKTLDSRVIDFAYLYDGWEGWVFRLPNFVRKEDTFASEYKRNVKKVTNYFNRVLQYFYEE